MSLDACLIRPFRPLERDGVNRVALAAFVEYRNDYDDWPGFGEGIGRMADPGAQAELLVAACDGIVAGAVVHVAPGRPGSAIFPDGWSVIRMLVVDPAFRGKGLGQALVAACLRSAIRDDAPAVGLHTSPIMASALCMYTGLGFTRDRDLDPIRGVPCGRYVLPAAGLRAALHQLGG